MANQPLDQQIHCLFRSPVTMVFNIRNSITFRVIILGMSGKLSAIERNQQQKTIETSKHPTIDRIRRYWKLVCLH